MINVAVSGAAGRMGQTVCEAVEQADDMALVGRADPLLETALLDVLGDADVLVDFSTPDAAVDNARTLPGGGRALRGGHDSARTSRRSRAWGRPTSSWPPTSRSARC